MSNLVEHAKRELALIGYTQEGAEPVNDFMYDHLIGMVTKFSEAGHSGSSAGYAIGILSKLFNYENLTPITNDPDEWYDHSEVQGSPLFQNKRNSALFSTDGGNTYYHVDNKEEILTAEQA